MKRLNSGSVRAVGDLKPRDLKALSVMSQVSLYCKDMLLQGSSANNQFLHGTMLLCHNLQTNAIHLFDRRK